MDGRAERFVAVRTVKGSGLDCDFDMALVICAAAVTLSMSLGLAAGPVQQSNQPGAARPAPRPDESVIVSIPATAPWTDTGLVLRAGDRLDMRAWGRVTYGRDEAARQVTPQGAGRGGGCRFAVVDASVAADAVVANIAPAVSFDGLGFQVGASRSVTLPVAGSTAQEGRLFVGINHQGVMCDRSGYDSWEFRNNGTGEFTVEIAVRRKK